jgi:hypothetical protein
MVLFLVAMSVALLAVTKKISEDDRVDKERSEAIAELRNEIDKILRSKEFEGVKLNGDTIDFGPRGTFADGKNSLTAPQQALLRQFTPLLLDKLRTTKVSRYWFKRAIVEGYASQSGMYLFNMNLSLERSARVLCELLREPRLSEVPFSDEDRKLIATKFFVGGASFNSLRESADNSRRIEFKLEFKSRQEWLDDKKKPPKEVDEAALQKALDPKELCPVFNR